VKKCRLEDPGHLKAAEVSKKKRGILEFQGIKIKSTGKALGGNKWKNHDRKGESEEQGSCKVLKGSVK